MYTVVPEEGIGKNGIPTPANKALGTEKLPVPFNSIDSEALIVILPTLPGPNVEAIICAPSFKVSFPVVIVILLLPPSPVPSSKT